MTRALFAVDAYVLALHACDREGCAHRREGTAAMFAGLDSEGNLVVTCGRDDVRASAVLAKPTASAPMPL